MRGAKVAVLGVWAVAAILLVTPAAAYYHFTHYANRVGPFQPMPDGTLHDEDVFTDILGLPNGKAKSGSGQIGKR